MHPHEFIRKVIELYHFAREPYFYNPNIFRGRSSSISSQFEDLTALFIALNNPNQCTYFTDQAMKFGNQTKYPDIVILENSGMIKNLVDLKTDTGWNRDGFYDFCLEWENNIEKIKGLSTSFKNGKTKKEVTAIFDQNIVYHIVVLSKINSGKNLELEINSINQECKNVKAYLLTDEIHPNEYKYSQEEKLEKIKIKINEFDRLITSIIG